MIVNGKKIYTFKADNKTVNFLTPFYLQSISSKFGDVEPEEVPLKGNAHDFSVNYDANYRSDILKIHKYLMFGFIKKNLMDFDFLINLLASIINASNHTKCF